MLEMHHELSDFHWMAASALTAPETVEAEPSNLGEVNTLVCASASKVAAKYHNTLANKTFCLLEDLFQQESVMIASSFYSIETGYESPSHDGDTHIQHSERTSFGSGTEPGANHSAETGLEQALSIRHSGLTRLRLLLQFSSSSEYDTNECSFLLRYFSVSLTIFIPDLPGQNRSSHQMFSKPFFDRCFDFVKGFFAKFIIQFVLARRWH